MKKKETVKTKKMTRNTRFTNMLIQSEQLADPLRSYLLRG